MNRDRSCSRVLRRAASSGGFFIEALLERVRLQLALTIEREELFDPRSSIGRKYF